MNVQKHHSAAGALALAVALALPVAASAQESAFNYIELNYINVDVDYSESMSEGPDVLSIKTDADSGFQFAGAWEFADQWHAFAEYSQAGQDLKIAGTFGGESFTGSGSFDLVRYRLGVGYAIEMTDATKLYGRLSFDGIEANDFVLDGENLGDSDDDGYGSEVGILWSATPKMQAQAHLRYSSVGKLESDGNDEFGNDLLLGLSGRWYLTDSFALQAGFETGDITTWHAGVRMSF